MEGSTAVLLQYGIAGVAIIGETVAIIVLWKYVQYLIGMLSAEKDARREDAKETLEKVTEPLSAISQSTKFIADKLISSKRKG
jgi:hypothetical protein